MKQHFFCFAQILMKRNDWIQKFTDDWNFLPKSDFDYIILNDNIIAKKVDSIFYYSHLSIKLSTKLKPLSIGNIEYTSVNCLENLILLFAILIHIQINLPTKSTQIIFHNYSKRSILGTIHSSFLFLLF